MKWPFLKFYTRDWQSDFELRMCSLEARGFWFECLCIMHNAKRRGFMETPKGDPLTDEQTARLIGTFKGDVLRCKTELATHGVFSEEEGTGIMYCRRMVRDTSKSKKCSEAGQRGGGAPPLQNKESKNTRNQNTRNHISLKVTFKGQELQPEEAFDLFWKSYPRKESKKFAKKTFESVFKHNKTLPLETILDAVEKANKLKWSQTERRFIPLASSWLNGERWTDDVEESGKLVKQETVGLR